MNNIYAFGGTFAFLPTHRAKQKNAKEPPSQRTKTYQVEGQHHDRKEGRTANSGFKKLAVQWLIEHLFFVSSAVLADSFVLRNRQLLKPAKR